MFSLLNLLVEPKFGKLRVAPLRCKKDCDLSMERLLTVHYETTRITFQKRGSDSILGFEEGHPHSKNHTCSI